jgi:nitrite reductase/ring-hydroxylating ferredoxin subunit/metal-sulfur cluster biosynthetic enzyme
MSKYVKVATVTDIPPGHKKVVEVEGTLIVLVNLGGKIYAIEDVCTHDGGPLGEGKLEGGELVCPRHGARFDVRTGAATRLPAFEPAPTYEVRVEGEDVLVHPPQFGGFRHFSERQPDEEEPAPAAPPASPPRPGIAPAPIDQTSADAVREVIRQNVYDPEIGLNIVDLGLVYDIQVPEGKTVEIKMTLTSPGCPIGPQIIGGVQSCIQRAFPDLDAINVHIVWEPLWGPERMSQEAKDQLGFF